MSQPQLPRPVKLIMGFLFRDAQIQRQILLRVIDRFGPLDSLTQPEPFTYTTYYEREMGPGLYRQTGTFLQLVPVETLPDIKLWTNSLEGELTQEGKRQVNIDPGLLSEERLILATGKNYTHRIYLRQGIYADLTLIYQKGAYRAFPWTYPDYQHPAMLHFLGAVRQKLIFQRNGQLPRKSTKKGASA